MSLSELHTTYTNVCSTFSLVFEANGFIASARRCYPKRRYVSDCRRQVSVVMYLSHNWSQIRYGVSGFGLLASGVCKASRPGSSAQITTTKLHPTYVAVRSKFSIVFKASGFVACDKRYDTTESIFPNASVRFRWSCL